MVFSRQTREHGSGNEAYLGGFLKVKLLAILSRLQNGIYSLQYEIAVGKVNMTRETFLDGAEPATNGKKTFLAK